MSHEGFGIRFLPREESGLGFGFPSFEEIIGHTEDIIGRFAPRGGGGPAPTGPTGTPERPGLPMPQNGMAPTFGTCRNTRNTSMPPSVADNGSLCCPSGWHLSTRKDPCTGNRNSCCVKNRRMNALNPRALSRSVRRLTSFNKTIARTQKALRRLAPARRRPAKPSDAQIRAEIKAAGIDIKTGKQFCK